MVIGFIAKPSDYVALVVKLFRQQYMSSKVKIPEEYLPAYEIFLSEAVGHDKYFQSTLDTIKDSPNNFDKFSESKKELSDRLHQIVGAAGFLQLEGLVTSIRSTEGNIRELAEKKEKKLIEDLISNLRGLVLELRMLPTMEDCQKS